MKTRTINSDKLHHSEQHRQLAHNNQNVEPSKEDQKLLEKWEATIRKGRESFLAVGKALYEIRSKRLYKINGYKTFEAYCQSKWKFSRQYASQLVLTFRWNEELSTEVDKPVIDSPHLAK